MLVEVLTWVPLWTPFAVLARLGLGIPTWEVIGSGLRARGVYCGVDWSWSAACSAPACSRKASGRT